MKRLHACKVHRSGIPLKNICWLHVQLSTRYILIKRHNPTILNNEKTANLRKDR